MPIVRLWHAANRNLEQSMDRPHGLRRRTTTATGQALPTAGARMSRHSALAGTRRITATAAIRSRGRTIRRPRPRTRRRELIPHQAAAIRHLRVPTPRPAAAEAAMAVAAVEAAAAAVGAVVTVVAAEVAAAVVAEARTAAVAGVVGAMVAA